ncbi:MULTISPECIES: membrane protein insertase YidC [Streptomyces]|uniref:Membrane protein insertase YidC n=1 Tax=Streptomyces noboritoensis TaxID=67337 RepID=A0ABV6TNC7_9ACTN|nr:membrane protein insertase YidC [Streptomyces melanogenes]GGP69906.1 membrane protein insertase YidC [Streptomyces melanogenes]
MDTIASLFSFITTPVSWVIVQFHRLYGAIFGPDTGWAWGLSIVSLVVLIRICLIPLFVKQIKSTRNMQALQPKMKAIQERYKSDKQRQSEEMMKLYKETGTNPLSSCLPILAQSPFFFALYHVLSGIASGKTIGVINQPLLESAQKAHIMGAPLAAKFTDSASKVESLGATLTDVRVVTAIMIVLMSASQFFTQRQLMTKNVDLSVKTPFMQQQKMLMYVFPVMFAVMGINFPVGVLVYWLTTNVWTMGQQMYVINQNPTPGSKAQASYLERLSKSIAAHSDVRGKRRRAVVQAIVAKGPDRNDNERKFITGLAKQGFAAQADGSVVKSEATAAEAEGSGPKRQQPKRQTKAQRQSGAVAQQGTADAEEPAKTSLDKGTSDEGSGAKQDAPQDAKSKPAAKPASGTARSKAQSGQRKGQQRPKHPSKK